jgi:hypothetical protein
MRDSAFRTWPTRFVAGVAGLDGHRISYSRNSLQITLVSKGLHPPPPFRVTQVKVPGIGPAPRSIWSYATKRRAA